MNRLPLPARAVLAPILAALLAAGLTVGCAPDRADSPTAPQAKAQRTPLGLGSQELGPALAAQAKHGARLMGIQGVVGHGVGVDADGEAVVRVFTVQPGVRGVPDRLDGVGVDVQVTGMFVPRQDRTARVRPAPIGFSVGHPDITAGTLGARVTDGSDVYILSNNHVIAASNAASIGDPTLQPGAFDGGSEPGDVIGTLADYEEILFTSGSTNVMDAAISLVDASDVSGSTPETAGYGAPGTSPVSATLGMGVQKYGRTTGHTHGEVNEINVTVSVCYRTRGPFMCAQSATFVDQISITDGDFSDGGDSGSLIVTDNTSKNPVGLLFAGSADRTIANPIGPVLERFGVSIDPTVPDGSDPDPGNQPPNASFTVTCTDLSCQFDGSGSTDDGTIVSYSWDFGDENTDTGETVSHTYEEGGDYTVVLTVTDDEDATDTDSQLVSVSADGGTDPGDGTTMSVAALSSSSVNNGSTWTAVVTITIRDDTGGAVSNASVEGSWSNGGSGSGNCTTDGGGRCSVSLSGIAKRVGSVTFTVDDVTHGSLAYDADANAQSSITVSKP